MIFVLGRARLRRRIFMMRADAIVMIALGANRARMLVRMTQAADDGIQRLQGDGQKSDEDVAAAAQS